MIKASTYNDMLEAHKRIKPFINYTPVLTSNTVNNYCGANIFFKCENFQKVGAFKIISKTLPALEGLFFYRTFR